MARIALDAMGGDFAPQATIAGALQALAELDLRPAIREEWLLPAPTFALCRDDCKGLCARCGADLNAGPHECSDVEGNPTWDGLRKMKQG